jgi:hypothetical protein
VNDENIRAWPCALSYTAVEASRFRNGGSNFDALLPTLQGVHPYAGSGRYKQKSNSRDSPSIIAIGTQPIPSI